MKNWIALFALTSLLALTACNDNDAIVDAWLLQIGGGGPELVYDIVETADGRICSTGSFWATVTFGAGERSRTLSTDGTQDIFVACYAPADGALSSVTQFGTHRGDDVRAIAALPNGDVVITGVFSGNFGAGAQPLLTARDSADIFLSRLDRDGNAVWSRSFSSAQADSGTALAVTADGDILLGGNFSQTMFFPIGTRTDKLNSAGQADGLIMKLSADGEVLWARRVGGSGYDTVTAIAIGADGTVIAGGYFQGEAELAGHKTTIRSAGYNDVFVTRLAADGDPLWLRRFGGNRQDTLDGLATDGKGRIHLAGSFQGTMDAGGKTLDSNGSTDLYLVRLSDTGATEHAYSIGSEHTDQLYDLTVAADGTLLYTGQFQGQMDFAPGRGRAMRKSARPGDANAFLLALDDNARLQAVRTVGGIGVEMGFAVTGLEQGGIAVAGVFNEQLDPRIASVEPLANRGKSDVFLLKVDR